MPATSAQRTDLRTTLLWLAVLIVVYLGLSLPLLSRVPRLVNDEVWTVTSGWALAKEGRLRNPVIRHRQGIDRALVHPALTQSVVLGGTYRLLGFSITSGRLASVFAGLLAVLGAYYLLRTWLSPSAAGLISLLFCTETQFFLFARVMRPEVFMTAVAVWQLALLARGTTRGSLWRCFAAGVIGAVGCYTHPNMTIFAVLGVPLIVYQVGIGRRALAMIGLYAAGGVVGVLPYVAYVLYAQAQYDVSMFEQLGRYYTEGVGEATESVFERERSRWDYYLQPLRRAPWVVLLGLGTLLGLIRRHPVQVWSLILIGGHIVLMALLIRSNAPRYLIPLGVWFAALIGMLIMQVWDGAGRLKQAGLQRRLLQIVAVTLLAGTLAVNLAGDAYVLYHCRQADYDSVCRRIASHIPAGSRVYGYLIFWAGLHEYPYHCDINEDEILGREMESVVRSWFVSFDPQYFVRSSDPCWGLGGFGPRPREPIWEGYGVSGPFMAIKAKVEDEFLRLRADLLDRFYHRDFGTISVYRIRR